MKGIENKSTVFHALSSLFQPLSSLGQLQSLGCLSTLHNSPLCLFKIYQGFNVNLGINQSYLILCDTQHFDECPEENVRHWWVCPLKSSLKIRIKETEETKLSSDITGFKLFQGEKECSFSLLTSNKEYSLKWLQILFQKVNISGFMQYYKAKKVLHKTQNVSIIKSEDKKTLNICAVKGYSIGLLSKDNLLAENIRKQIQILRQLEHPAIIELKAVHESEGSLYVVEQILEGGTLYDRLMDTRGTFQRLTHQEIKYIIYWVLEALQYLSLNKIYHGSLNPKNIMFHSPKNLKPVLIDFKNAGFINTHHISQIPLEMPEYVAPELFRAHKSQDVFITEKSDVFSLGVIWSIMLKKTMPMASELIEQETREVKEEWRQADKQAKQGQQREDGLDLLSKMINKDERARISASQALLHPYFKNLKQSRLKQCEQTYKFDRN